VKSDMDKIEEAKKVLKEYDEKFLELLTKEMGIKDFDEEINRLREETIRKIKDILY
jgi:hypothetical protein